MSRKTRKRQAQQRKARVRAVIEALVLNIIGGIIATLIVELFKP